MKAPRIASLKYPVTPLEAASQLQISLRQAANMLLIAQSDGYLFRIRASGRWLYSPTEQGLLLISLYL